MTPLRIDFHPLAIAEARAATEWYGEHSVKAAAAFSPNLIEQLSELSPPRKRALRICTVLGSTASGASPTWLFILRQAPRWSLSPWRMAGAALAIGRNECPESSFFQWPSTGHFRSGAQLFGSQPRLL
jgi:hypothetical protein